MLVSAISFARGVAMQEEASTARIARVKCIVTLEASELKEEPRMFRMGFNLRLTAYRAVKVRNGTIRSVVLGSERANNSWFTVIGSNE